MFLVRMGWGAKMKKLWECECGQSCQAEDNPTDGFPLWADGHRCNFKEIKIHKQTYIMNYDFLVVDEKKFYAWLSKGYEEGAFAKEECILMEEYY